MEQMANIPEQFLPYFKGCFYSAGRVCDNILGYKPDLVISLLHSGWGPVFAAQSLWQKTQSAPFPTVVKTNLGREKLIKFDEAFSLETSSQFVGEFSDNIDVGRLLAYISQRQDWQQQLAGQVSSSLPEGCNPQRILVVDESVYEGSTYMLTLGLLAHIFPQAQVRFLNASGWFRNIYADLFLAALCPPGLFTPGDSPSADQTRRMIEYVAVGSYSRDDDSLEWEPISVDSPPVQALSRFWPAENWVNIPKTIYATIAQYVEDRAAEYEPAEPNPDDYKFALKKEWLVMRDIWLENGLTRRQAQERYGLSNWEATKMLTRFLEHGVLTRKRNGRATCYLIPLALQNKINKTGPGLAEWDTNYWLIPGRLMFGEPPYFSNTEPDEEYDLDLVRKVLAYDVDSWLDVRVLYEDETDIGENPFFRKECERLGRSAKVTCQTFTDKHYGLRFGCSRKYSSIQTDLRATLDLIDGLLVDNRIVFVSAPFYLRGVIAGCYLVRQGYTGKEAIKEVQRCFSSTARGWTPEPPESCSRRIIRNWPEGNQRAGGTSSLDQ